VVEDQNITATSRLSVRTAMCTAYQEAACSHISRASFLCGDLEDYCVCVKKCSVILRPVCEFSSVSGKLILRSFFAVRQMAARFRFAAIC